MQRPLIMILSLSLRKRRGKARSRQTLCFDFFVGEGAEGTYEPIYVQYLT